MSAANGKPRGDRDAALSTQALAYLRLLSYVEVEARKQFQQAARQLRGAAALRADELCADEPSAKASHADAAPGVEASCADTEVLRAEASSAAAARSPDAAGALQPSLSAIRHALRQEKSVPLLEQFGGWLRAQQAAQGGAVLPKSPMGQAITYTLNQWPALNVYTTDGDLAIDNNASENALRRVALGRKNWLFCGSDNGGHTAAVLFSIIATCQRHHVEPLAYLRNLLTRIAAQPASQLAELLPTANPPA